jgi:hypothetical protein
MLIVDRLPVLVALTVLTAGALAKSTRTLRLRRSNVYEERSPVLATARVVRYS